MNKNRSTTITYSIIHVVIFNIQDEYRILIYIYIYIYIYINSQSFWAKQIQFASLKHLSVRGDNYVWTLKWRHMRRRLSFETQK